MTHKAFSVAHTLTHYAPPMDPPLSLLHEDEDLLVFDKPSGILSVPGKNPEHEDSMLVRAQKAYPASLLVHRLDMETSGIFLMAHNKTAQRHLGHQFEKRRTSKTYIAVVAGHLSADEGTVDLPLICDWPNRPRQMVDHENGKPAITRWRMLERLEAHDAQTSSSRIALFPETGRSHQLRVHMQAIGHPILGDPLYSSTEFQAAAPRLMLHAESITVTHPGTKEWITFSAPVPF